MKKVLALLAMVLALAFTSTAQTSSSSGMAQSDQKMGQKKSDMSSDHMGMSDHMGKAGKAKKESTLTGCLSAQPNAEGMYTLSNGRYKKGVEVGPSDKVKEHAGHQVQLTGEWSSAMAAGEQKESGAAAAKEKSEKHFEVASLKHISETCKEAPGGGTTGMTKKGKKTGETAKQ